MFLHSWSLLSILLPRSPEGPPWEVSKNLVCRSNQTSFLPSSKDRESSHLLRLWSFCITAFAPNSELCSEGRKARREFLCSFSLSEKGCVKVSRMEKFLRGRDGEF
ncbi:hypothetical protein BDY24DRAFT_385029 [Mrakia frigida]|uniref:uncharacterized protein n=1 Tax=Mrakia frigida TaxID=29902 RepID=UPI003FCBEFBE